MAWKIHRIVIMFRFIVFLSACIFTNAIPLHGTVCAQDPTPKSHRREILFGGGFLIPTHPDVYADAATGIGVKAETGLGFVLSDQITMAGWIGVGYVPAGYKFEPEFLEICSDQYEFESLIYFYGMSDVRMYTVPDEDQEVRPYILAGAGIWNARQKSTFTERDLENFQCIILQKDEDKTSKWSLAASGGFGLDVSIEDKNFTLLFQAKYLWVMDAIFDNMQNVVVEMIAAFRL